MIVVSECKAGYKFIRLFIFFNLQKNMDLKEPLYAEQRNGRRNVRRNGSFIVLMQLGSKKLFSIS